MTDQTQDPRPSSNPPVGASPHRFYCPTLAGAAADSLLSESAVSLDRAEDHHARRVLRLGPGATVELFDGRGAVAAGVLAEGGHVRVTHWRHQPPDAPAVDLAVALPKGRHGDDLVPMLSQLGVRRLIPLRTKRGVVQPGGAKLDKFRRAAVESAKQCRRAHLLVIEEPRTLDETLTDEHGLRLLADPSGRALPTDRCVVADVLVLVGPEGGWTEQELGLAAARGCLRWRFASQVLRIETATVAAAAIAGYLLRPPAGHD